jgi:hypothetical protein
MSRAWPIFVAALTACVAATAQQPSPTALAAGERVSRDISGIEGHEYRVALKAGQALHLVVNQFDVDVVVVATAPDGKTLVEVDNPGGARASEEVRLIAANDGVYGVVVRPFRNVTTGGRYELVVIAVRTATQDDRWRAEMQDALFAASQLPTRPDNGSRTSVVRRLRDAASVARTLNDTPALATINNQLIGLEPKAALDDLGVQMLPGAMPVYASRGLTQRAETLRDRLIPAVAFFETRLGVKSTVHLAVLERQDWEKLSMNPYGVPWVNSTPTGTSAVVCAPATLDVFDEFTRSIQRGQGLPAETLRALDATGLSLEQGMREAADDLLYHELGHLFTRAYGIDPQHLWFNEFLANYLMEAYLAEAEPTPRGRIFGIARRNWFLGLSPRYRSLDDLERLYASMGIENYGWYQSQFEQQVVSVYKAQGVDFLRRVKSAFPVGAPRASVSEVLGRLEAITPGFAQWSQNLAGQSSRP